MLSSSKISERNLSKKYKRDYLSNQFSKSAEGESIIKKDFSSSSSNVERLSPIILSKMSNESSDNSVSLEDFKILKFISKGTFGSVFIAYLPSKDLYYAIKCINRDDLEEKDLLAAVKLEKFIMHNVNHPFIVKMHYVYQKNHRIYFVMDYIGGGELFKHIQEKRRFTESQAKFIMAQVVLAIGYLHKEMNVIYRDLKPENIIFDEDGYVKLTDFGLAK